MLTSTLTTREIVHIAPEKQTSAVVAATDMAVANTAVVMGAKVIVDAARRGLDASRDRPWM